MDDTIVAERATLIALPQSALTPECPSHRARYMRELVELCDRAAQDPGLGVADRMDWSHSAHMARQELNAELARYSKRGA